MKGLVSRSLLMIAGLWLAVAPVWATTASTAAQRQALTRELPGHLLPELAHATVAPAKPHSGAQPLTLTFVLRRDDQTGFEHYLQNVYNPHSKIFRHYLTQRQIADRFGPRASDYQSLISYLRHHGFKILARSQNRLTVTVRGTRAQAEHAFNVRIRDYQLDGRTFYANDRDPALPVRLAVRVQAVQGLSDLARPHRAAIKYALVTWYCAAVNPIQSADLKIKNACEDIQNQISHYKACVSGAGVTLKADDQFEQQLQKQLSAAFKNNCTTPSPAPAAVVRQTESDPSFDGTGQKIGLLEFDSFNPADVQNFLRCLAIRRARLPI
jgi:subtilase family serine protease